MKFQYTLKDGTTIEDSWEMIEIGNYYEAACTGEYIQNEYVPSLSDEEALAIGYEVRRRMNKANWYDGEAEETYIREVLEEEGLLEEND